MNDANPGAVRRIVMAPDSARTIRRTVTEADDGAETGGILLGRVEDDGTAHVRQAGTPGPAAIRTPNYFLRDLAHAQHLAEAAFRTDGSIWIGEWHTHPRADAVPSPRDLLTYSTLLADPALAFDVVLAIVIGPLLPAATTRVVGWACTTTGVTAVPVESEVLLIPEELRGT
ncbi:Mov34/MPN/PAD-1 family protein [Saccharothrix australiensis]|uniref:Mov34/MPN/PAD-1 family protein n=1 Tax=Saccharothrix australiensis TaxID=2072 RepID=UPI001B86EC43|nr:Mov34/MPN/PAD-1 family protein [Saccharothrix australiensis]